MYNNLDKAIINVCRYEYDNFLSKSNVVGIGYGYKYIKNIQTNEKVIQVFVKNKVSSNCLNAKERIPLFYKNIKTDVIETGECKVASLTDRVRPVTGGYCIGPAGILICGTYGGLVRDLNDYYMLSNNHVIAVDNLVPLGNPILQPCTNWGGASPEDVVAELSRFIPINFKTATTQPLNYADAAIAKIVDLSLISPEIKFIGVPKGAKLATLLMQVQMTGQVSELILGTIVSLNASITIKHVGGKEALYTEQIISTPPCAKGDSGALVLDLDNYVIGLNFAINNLYSIINPINYILNALQVEIVTDNNFIYPSQIVKNINNTF